MSAGVLILLCVLIVLLVLAVRMRQDPAPVIKRFIEQFAMLLPRMIMALFAAGFIATLIPSAFISKYLGPESGFLGIFIGAAAGLTVPAGPVIAFPIAAVFAKSGASDAALVAFITSWSVFAMHRILIYEIPMLGTGFLRVRIVSAIITPFLAGALAMFFGALV
jgi:Predicted permeases